MKKILLIFLILVASHGNSQRLETNTYLKNEWVKQRNEHIKKAEQLQKSIDSIDKKIYNKGSNRLYLTKTTSKTTEANYINTLNNNSDNSTTRKSYNYKTSRTYHRGPRGGCYYINSNGNKSYVDRSRCN